MSINVWIPCDTRPIILTGSGTCTVCHGDAVDGVCLSCGGPEYVIEDREGEANVNGEVGGILDRARGCFTQESYNCGRISGTDLLALLPGLYLSCPRRASTWDTLAVLAEAAVNQGREIAWG